ncbi:solute carrier family 2, facilitated glucose transporter member 1-like isoform X2 [Cimex lectularius]|uniref:Major facilitator superfamily (MFS) profile domain-containing protein n=2 Tax=Cimex lectularius TaxID=79782 RepID=A0A8I6TKT0_CIMLE|nr:solute carrier family 2, facilitated glucose transporter member 1-like isoform X2 [Cimex lectularius]
MVTRLIEVDDMDLDKRCLYEPAFPKSEMSQSANVNLGWTRKLVLAGASTTIGLAVPVGFSIGVVNTPAGIIKAWCNESVAAHYNIALDSTGLDSIWSCIVSIYLIGGMVGSLGGAWVADRIGRKGGLVLAAIFLLVAALMFIVSKPLNSIEVVLLGRIVAGLGGGLVTTIMPMYLTELAPIEVRGATGVLCPLGLSLGVPISQGLGFPMIFGSENCWNYLLGMYAVLTLLSAIALPFLPESPKYLYTIRGLRQKAIKELTSLRQLPAEFVVGELEEKTDSEPETWSIVKLIANRPLRIKLLLVCALQGGQQFSGINAVFYYSVRIFEMAGLSQANAQYASLGAGSINFIVAAIMIPVINLFPRRAMAILSCTFGTAFLVVLSFAITYTVTFSWMLYLSTVSLFGYIIMYGIGLGPIPFFIGSELFDLGPRSAAMALGSVANWAGNFIVGMTFLRLNNKLGPYVFLLFATSTALLALFLKVCLPETNVVTLAKRRKQSLK